MRAGGDGRRQPRVVQRARGLGRLHRPLLREDARPGGGRHARRLRSYLGLPSLRDREGTGHARLRLTSARAPQLAATEADRLELLRLTEPEPTDELGELT